MTKLDTATDLIRYQDDYHAWTLQQAALVKAGRFADLDGKNLADELKGLAMSEEREIEKRLTVLLQHLLKWEFQPDARTNSWRASILEQRNRINRVIRRSPSLQRHPDTVIDEEYRIARLRAADETGLALSRFPSACPYSTADVLDEQFWPGEADNFEK
jgi:Domain of unknown function DUF29